MTQIALTRPLERNQLPPATSPTLVWHPDCPPFVVEQYKRLALNLRRTEAGGPHSIVAVTSALPQEGKTLTAVNLAMTIAESYRERVLLIDADLPRPGVSSILELRAGVVGLAAWLADTAMGGLPIVRITPKFAVIPAGSAEGDRIALLSSERMRTLLTMCRAEFDWIVIDTPPVGLLCDAHVLGGCVDRFLMVIAASRTPYTVVKEAIAALGRERVAGVILNRARSKVRSDYEKYTEYYSKPLDKPLASKRYR